MSDILVISLSWVDIFFVTLILISSVLFVYFSVIRHIHNYKVGLLSKVTNDIEESYKRKIRTSPVTPINPMTAEEANKLKQASVTQAQVDDLLKPVFDKVAKASEKGDSEIFLSGEGWYYNKNEKYKLATQQLTGLGYGVWKSNDVFGVRVKW